MYRKLLVALDGSSFAEHGGRLAGAWAARTGGSVTLFHVLERDAPARIHGEPHLREEAEALAYLKEAARRLIPREVPVTSEVDASAFNPVDVCIANRMARKDHDMLVMSPHGGANLRRLLQGSLPERVAGHSLDPILIAKGSYAGGESHPFETIVIPDDADPRHEEGWQACLEIVRTFEVSVCLVAVARESFDPQTGKGGAGLLQPAASRDLLRLQREEMTKHLENHRAEMSAFCHTVETRVLEGDPARAVSEFAIEHRAGLVILRTHSRAGLVPRLAGGFAATFLARTQTNVLLLPLSKHVRE